MTREEAIEYGKECLSWNQFSKGMKMYQFIEMAIQALSQECVGSTQQSVGNALEMRCEDAISRQAVLDGIEELKKSPWCTDKRGNGFEYLITEALDVVKDLCIKQLPSVTQKSGEWVIKEDNTSYVKTIPRRWAECSCCKWSMSPGYVDRYAFCPNCGAKMVEPQKKRCEGCKHYGKLSLDCGRCDDDCSMYEPQESE